ncbi:Hypothetical_protein [Hexamita inflata]|uniref:Hypothetical_protein n=1 Tax=Hexamita inflata TaxID=28002 RepID=A0ABP1J619_9EUKA
MSWLSLVQTCPEYQYLQKFEEHNRKLLEQPTCQLNVQYSNLVTARSNKVLSMIQIFHDVQALLNNSVSVKRTFQFRGSPRLQMQSVQMIQICSILNIFKEKQSGNII